MDNEDTRVTGESEPTFSHPAQVVSGDHDLEPAGLPLEDQAFSIESHWVYKLVGWAGLIFWLAGIFFTSSVLKTDPILGYTFDALILIPIFLNFCTNLFLVRFLILKIGDIDNAAFLTGQFFS